MRDEGLSPWDEYKKDVIRDFPGLEPVLNGLESTVRRLCREFRSHPFTAVTGSAFFVLVYIFFHSVHKLDTTSVQKYGATGDFVAGTLGTLLGVISVIALFVTLKNDRLAKEEEGFEDKYYQLLKLHRANVAEIRLGTSFGRRVFVLMIREFRCILDQVKAVSAKNNFELSRRELICASYFALFYGVGPNSTRMLIEGLVNVGFQKHIASCIATRLDNKTLKKTIQSKRKFEYVPFEGHQSRLGHYFRHLYQMVTYVHCQDMRKFAPAISEKEQKERKRQYIKTIRAQLSTHEQALLLLNSLTPIGSVWWDERIILDYGLVKNLPISFFEKFSEIDVAMHIRNKDYFEDAEIRSKSEGQWQGWPEEPY